MGRVFWHEPEKGKRVLIVVGRNEEENLKLEKLRKKGDVLIEPEFPGPSVLLRSFGKGFEDEDGGESIKKGKELVIVYSKHRKGKEIKDKEFKIC